MDILQHNLEKSKQKGFFYIYPAKFEFIHKLTTERDISESWKQSFLPGVYLLVITYYY